MEFRTVKVTVVHNLVFWYVRRVLANTILFRCATVGGNRTEECILLWAMYSRFRIDVASHMVRHWMFHASRISDTISFGGLLTPNALKVRMDLSRPSPLPGDIPTINLKYVTLTDKFDLHEGAYYVKFNGNTGTRLWLPTNLTSIADRTGSCFPALRLQPEKKP
ncbi:hypothetical protein Droror1_Dr00027789 [Drosera rotundifolia]